MKYYFGALCVVFAGWLVFRALGHRRSVMDARLRAEREPRGAAEPQVTHHVKGLQSLRSGCAPLFVFAIFVIGISLAALWLVLDREGILSPLDIAGFVVAVLAYVFSMIVRLRYSVLGLSQGAGGGAPAEQAVGADP